MEKQTAMPKAYKTPEGRVVSANPNLHRMVVESKGKYGSYAPCDEEGNVIAGHEPAKTYTAEELEAAKERGIDQGWQEARAELAPSIEKAKAEATEEAEANIADRIEAAKAEAFAAGKAEGSKESKAPKGKKG